MHSVPCIFAALIFSTTLTLTSISCSMERASEELPPHEFAYGSFLPHTEDLPKTVQRFLSMDIIDGNTVYVTYFYTKYKISAEQIEQMAKKAIERNDQDAFMKLQTYVQENDQGSLSAFRKFLERHYRTANLQDLLSFLRKAEKKERLSVEEATGFVQQLVKYRAALMQGKKPEDDLILFLKYSFKKYESLPDAMTEKVENSISQYDSANDLAKYKSKRCPDNYLEGNINLYPQTMDNVSWYKVPRVRKASKDTLPIFEYRFMGLKGLFSVINAEVTSKLGLESVWLDGEEYEP